MSDPADSGGYVKVFRSLFRNWTFHNRASVGWLWIYLLTKATYTKTTVCIEGVPIALKPGQLVFGRITAKKETGLSEQTIRTALRRLSEVGCLKSTTHSTNRCSVITICNWESYQSWNGETNQQSNQPPTSRQPAANHIQEGKEGRRR